ncbi:hypothetical protein MGG_16066 [Pyricularia oryzae 70-15]|uniref:Uncharacterized protein n=1 Tax=Pyricularia oryzae (strain 70-15 / ATCC MYA-4617 / FGSC 8958) TaxID=242507 RepID=G4MPM3_PYRO7|nr:uncharacterized protein MGG_16066 [Pyricularia oryzae 70-15]EHA56372.1 hypothetical protein MGG_16066 [Pyricularia oryzae 70-15]
MEAPAAGASVIGVISLALQPADSAIKLDSFIDTIMYSNIKGAHKAVYNYLAAEGTFFERSRTYWRSFPVGMPERKG